MAAEVLTLRHCISNGLHLVLVASLPAWLMSGQRTLSLVLTCDLSQTFSSFRRGEGKPLNFGDLCLKQPFFLAFFFFPSASFPTATR